MDAELSKFLDQVWNKRNSLLLDEPSGNYEKEDEYVDSDGCRSVEGRIYNMYNNSDSTSTEKKIKKATKYHGTLSALDNIDNKVWIDKSDDWWLKFDNKVLSSSTNSKLANATTRIYLNAKKKSAVTIFMNILDMGGEKGAYKDYIVAAKLASAWEAVSGRADIIVVYLNATIQKPALAALLKELNIPGCYDEAIPAMTKKIAPGIGVGTEPEGVQRKVGHSFGEVRSRLIARALVEAVTGRSYDNDQVKERDKVHGLRLIELGAKGMGQFGIRVPVKLKEPNRIKDENLKDIFIKKVEEYFPKFNININKPWKAIQKNSQ